MTAENNGILGSAIAIGGGDARSGNSGNSGPTGDAVAIGRATSSANSGAEAISEAFTGSTGDAVNGLDVVAIGGEGGSGGVAIVAAGDPLLGLGFGIAVGEANGGNAGRVTVEADLSADSGDSGNATAQSSSTNYGDTGNATSESVSVPRAVSGNSGPTGHTGEAVSLLEAINNVILGLALALDL